MHELAICQALIDEVTSVARAEKANRVSDVFVSVGPLSGVEHPLMQNAFPIAAAVLCGECGEESEVPANKLVCKRCGNWRTQLLSGDELVLQRVICGHRERSEAIHGLLRPSGSQ